VNGSLARDRVLTVLDLLLVNDPSPGVRAVLRAPTRTRTGTPCATRWPPGTARGWSPWPGGRRP
jgi:hypothetical protein